MRMCEGVRERERGGGNNGEHVRGGKEGRRGGKWNGLRYNVCVRETDGGSVV